MLYTKTYKTVEEQADLLIRRGLVCNRDTLIERLNWINYYRLSGYLFPFRKPNSDDFVEGTNLDQVWERYCVVAFKTKYGDSEESLPLWMAIELMTFGSMLKFYEGMHKNLQNEISMAFSQQKGAFISWMKSLNVVRNICAHHERLWNRILGVTPILFPKKKAKKRLLKLLESYPNIPLCEMGFPEDWEKTPFFAEVA